MVPPDPIPLRSALAFWGRLGLISFGGPAGQIALMHDELVARRHWISERRFLHALNFCMVLPGPEAQQLATYLGWLMHRTAGGVAAGVLFVLPSLVLMIVLAGLYLSWGHSPLVAGLFDGIKPAVTALVLQAVHRIGSRTLRNPTLWAIAAAAFLALAVGHAPFPAIVLGAALVGAIGARRWPATFATAGGGHGPTGATSAPALIDDDTPPPPHARPSKAGLARVLGVGLLLWAAPLAGLVAWQGASGTLPQMAGFFTKAALLTFGGAYAVLPYVYQGAVLDHGWLTGPQMIDGLALGETTPGPLIMVVTFVGFVGGWHSPDLQALLGVGHPWLTGTLAALVVTWFTFLPSFVFILAGGPLVEATHGKIALTGPLTAITAAVVGVILNLALFFALHTFWPTGWAGPFDPMAALIAAGAAWALIRGRQGVIRVIAVCALLGLARTFF